MCHDGYGFSCHFDSGCGGSALLFIIWYLCQPVLQNLVGVGFHGSQVNVVL